MASDKLFLTSARPTGFIGLTATATVVGGFCFIFLDFVYQVSLLQEYNEKNGEILSKIKPGHFRYQMRILW
jgi:hypothetical protein